METRMPFVLSPHFLDKLKSLKYDYECKTGFNLSKAQSSSPIYCFFGARDTSTRKKQIDFLTVLYNELIPYINDINDNGMLPQQKQTSFDSLHILVVACLYIQSQVIKSYRFKKPSSVLNTLIDVALGVTSTNPLSDRIKKTYIASSLDRIKYFEQILLKFKPFNHMEPKAWDEFKRYLKSVSQSPQANTLPSTFPIANTIKPLVGIPCSIAGRQAGYMLGAFMAEKNMIATGLLVRGLTQYSAVISSLPVTYVAGAVFVPAITLNILNRFYDISLPFILGGVFGLIGEGIGFGVGLSFDLSLLILKQALVTLKTTINHDSTKPISKLILSHEWASDCELVTANQGNLQRNQFRASNVAESTNLKSSII